MSTPVFVKAPPDRVDIDYDLDRWLPFDDRIVGATATIANTTATIGPVTWDDRKVKVWTQGGTDGETGVCTIVATTNQGRIKERCFRLRIKECAPTTTT